MSAVELNQRAITDLGTGNLVGPSETLKEQIARLLEALDRHAEDAEQGKLGDSEQVEEFIDAIAPELGGFLAVALPLIEYGSEPGQEAVVTALARLAQEIERAGRMPMWQQALLALVSRLVWVTAAFALSSERLEFLLRLCRVTVHSPYDGRSQGVIDNDKTRYLAAFDGSAKLAFEAHQQWLGKLGLIEELYPLLARDEELIRALMEADMLLAMHAVATRAHSQPYSHGAHQRDQPAEKRLQARVTDPRQRRLLATFVGTSDDQLEQRLAELHRALPRAPGSWVGEEPLFALPDDR